MGIMNCEYIKDVKYKKLSKLELEKNLELAKNGNDEAYTKILCHMHKYLCHITNEFFIQGAESQDVYQEGAIKLINVIEKFDATKSGFTTFAQSSIRKHLITTINKEKALKRTILNSSCSLDSKITNNDGDEVPIINLIPSTGENIITSGETIDPLDVIQKDYECFLIEKISESLSEMERKVFYLRFIRGLSYKEVAKELDLYKTNKRTGKKILDQKSIDNAIWRSRPKIKKVLEKLKLNKQETIKGELKNGKNKKVQDSSGNARGRNIYIVESSCGKENDSNDTRNRRIREHHISSSDSERPKSIFRSGRGAVSGRCSKWKKSEHNYIRNRQRTNRGRFKRI